MVATRSIAAPRRATRTFYVGLSAFVGIFAVVGFWPTYFGQLLAGAIDALPLIHFHAAVYVGWLAVFAAQAVLAAKGRIDLHIRLGRFGIGYGMLVIIAGLLAALGMFVVRVQAGAIDDARGRLVGPLLDMLAFAAVFGSAIIYRRKPAVHKRLMIVAMAVLLAPAVGRMRWFLPANMAIIQLVWSSPILIAMVYDYAKHRMVHVAYVVGLVVLMAESAPTRLWIRGSDAWHGFSTWLAATVQ